MPNDSTILGNTDSTIENKGTQVKPPVPPRRRGGEVSSSPSVSPQGNILSAQELKTPPKLPYLELSMRQDAHPVQNITDYTKVPVLIKESMSRNHISSNNAKNEAINEAIERQLSRAVNGAIYGKGMLLEKQQSVIIDEISTLLNKSSAYNILNCPSADQESIINYTQERITEYLNGPATTLPTVTPKANEVVENIIQKFQSNRNQHQDSKIEGSLGVSMSDKSMKKLKKELVKQLSIAKNREILDKITPDKFFDRLASQLATLIKNKIVFEDNYIANLKDVTARTAVAAVLESYKSEFKANKLSKIARNIVVNCAVTVRTADTNNSITASNTPSTKHHSEHGFEH